MNQEQTFRI